ncbi:UDPglucose 6-dehydrogenase [Homoserinimonas aerilata]|uniref:UDP-glucose 6-dehydrogenase n=1 Tax=Homoserinimonas aerilata TaxID=1162970 RepID=A0A542YKP4_9MICO|nr:UDP-glucose/GDP-mannose dehydrogenase family protein [Homoserinimonas aerilata]TQL48669.1 UDPglucose 6-dehydrogenase [Homoserinimonas aerilata]
MKISVIGCGYLGAVHAACMAELGHEVIGIDVDAAKIALLAEGHPPFFEPGLPELLLSASASGRLRFSTDVAQIAEARVHFVAVGTPQLEGSNAADLRFVDAAIESLLPHLKPGDLVVGKSTVPVGTAARLVGLVESTGASLAWNPEFLREGFAVKDTLAPDRLVYGIAPGDVTAEALLDGVYASALAAGSPKVVTDFATAELVKVSANAFLATKISFINAMAEVAEATGADVTQLADAIGYDARIGRRFLNAGLGFGGGCLPKDIRAFMARAEELGVDQALSFLSEVDGINMRRRERMVDLAREVVGGDVAGKRIAVLGLAFKPDSDDVRDSPALDVALRLTELGADVVATDPQALETTRRRAPQLVTVASAQEAATGADAVLLLTEWREFRELDPVALASLARVPAIVDGRNCLDPVQWREAGWTYRALGRP